MEIKGKPDGRGEGRQPPDEEVDHHLLACHTSQNAQNDKNEVAEQVRAWSRIQGSGCRFSV